MKFVISSHAQQRMRERGLSRGIIRQALSQPTERLYDDRGRILFKFLYSVNHQTRLLLVAAEMKNDALRVITVIETSKVRKYLS